MESDQLLENVGNLLSLLERVEQGILDDSSSLNSQVGTRLAKRLRQVADLVDKECNAVEILDDYSAQTQDVQGHLALGQLQVKKEGSAQQQLSEEDTNSMESTETEIQVKGEGRAPTPPIMAPPQQPHLHHASSAPASVVTQPATLQPQLGPQQQNLQQGRPSMYKRFSNSQPEPLDAIARKRRREAEEMVRKLDRPQSYTCGLSYTGDERERDFSNGIKEDLKHHLPALKINRHIFHYMAWATTQRLECNHCKKCPNTYQ